MIIDSHVHLIPAPYQTEYLKWLSRSENREFGPVYLWNDPGFEDEDRHLSEMDRYGIDYEIITYSANCMQILEALTEQGGKRCELLADMNSRMVKLSGKTAGRLIPLAFIVPDEGQAAVKEMERLAPVCGGYSMVTGYRNGDGMKFLDHPDYEPVWEMAEKMNKPVFIHFASRYRLHEAEAPLPGYMSNMLLHAGFGQLTEDTVGIVRFVLSGLLDRHPGLRVVFGQLGGLYPFMLERFDMLYGMYAEGAQKAGLVVDDPGRPEQFLRRLSDYKRQIFVDTHSMSGASIRCAAEMIGGNQILFGSDYPITPAHFGREHGLSVVDSLPDELKEAVLWKNAAGLMGFDLGGER